MTGPGKYLVLMIWWILAFFILQIASFSIWAHFSSYLVFFIAFAFTLAFAIALNLMEAKRKLWSRRGHWGKYVVLTSAYTVAIVASLVVTVTLDSYRLVAYVGGDAGGSFGLLYIPSVLFYWLAGAVVCAIIPNPSSD